MTSVDRMPDALECPPAEQLACFLDGALASAAVADLELHLSMCDRCCSIVADLANVDVDPGTAEHATQDGDLVALEDRLAIGRLGRYTLLERIGAGAMGVVWAAYDTELERRVAIKLLRYDDAGSADARARRRLVREARAMARVSHPNVVAVHDVVEEDDRVFMTMELVAGRTLGAWLRERPRQWHEIAQVFLAAGRGVAAAHDRGVVHRDFKPDNVLVGDDGHVRVGDFGLAHTGIDTPTLASSDTRVADDSALARDTIASHAAKFVGTPAYMAPEQFSGGPVDARTDQFAFCIALWEALYGARPFEGSSLSALAASITAAEVPTPSDRRGVPTRVQQVLRRGLAREPDARWSSMSALLRELEAAFGRRTGLRWLIAALLGAGVVAVVAWPEPSPCRDPPPWLAGAWDDARRQRVHTAASARSEAASALATRLTSAIDERMADMTEAFAASCRAAFVDHTQTVDDHDARLTCLRRGAAAIEVVADFAVDANELGLARALPVTTGLAGVDACEELARVRTDLPWLAASDRELAIELDLAVFQAQQLRRLGEFESARARLADALAAAGDPLLGTIAAAARLELALLERREGVPGDRLREALAEAVDCGNDGAVFDVLSHLVFDAGVRRHDRAAAETYAELALAFVGRSGRGDDGRGQVLLHLGQARERTGDPAGSRTALLAAEAAFTTTGTLDEPRNFPLWMALGLVDELAGNLAAAEARYERVRDRLEAAYGAYHPDLAVALEYLATVRRKRGAFADALADAERSLTIRRAVLGPKHPETAVTLAGIGEIRIDQGRLDEAEAPIAEAITIWRSRGTDDRNIALSEALLADIYRSRGAFAEALPRYREALALAERTLGAEHPELAIFLHGVAACELALGTPRAAIAPLERARTLLDDGNADPVLRARVQLELARSLAAVNTDPARVAALTDAARSDAAKASRGVTADALTREIDAFVASGRRR